MVKINDNDKEPERYYDWIGWKLRQERKKRMKNGKIKEEQARMQSDHLEIMDMVNHPPHYNQAGIEALDAILAATNEGSEYYLQGNIIKYLWRYRSKFELELAHILMRHKVKFQYESKKFLYIPKPRTYTPDFYIPETNIFIEAKGHLDKADRVKMALVKEQHKDLDIRFVFMNAKNKIYKGSKTTYADWCLRHDFQWAEKTIPLEWFKNGKR